MSLKVERGRTLARSQALQLMFQAEIREETVDEVLDGDYLLARASEDASPLVPYAAELARGCYAHLDEIDRGLRRVSENWALERMPGSDRNLLRLAVYELRFAPEQVDDAVVINEAVEIAKAYGTDESASFVNGVLGRVVRDTRIFPRRATQEVAAASSNGANEEAEVQAAADSVAASADSMPSEESQHTAEPEASLQAETSEASQGAVGQAPVSSERTL